VIEGVNGNVQCVPLAPRYENQFDAMSTGLETVSLEAEEVNPCEESGS
jgi:hypothetical protein